MDGANDWDIVTPLSKADLAEAVVVVWHALCIPRYEASVDPTNYRMAIVTTEVVGRTRK